MSVGGRLGRRQDSCHGQELARHAGIERSRQLLAKRDCKELTDASFAVCSRPARLYLDLQRHRESFRHGLHRVDHDPPGLLDQRFRHLKSTLSCTGKSILTASGRSLLQPDQGQLHQVGGGALDDRVDGLAVGFCGEGRGWPSRCSASSGGGRRGCGLRRCCTPADGPRRSRPRRRIGGGVGGQEGFGRCMGTPSSSASPSAVCP